MDELPRQFGGSNLGSAILQRSENSQDDFHQWEGVEFHLDPSRFNAQSPKFGPALALRDTLRQALTRRPFDYQEGIDLSAHNAQIPEFQVAIKEYFEQCEVSNFIVRSYENGKKTVTPHNDVRTLDDVFLGAVSFDVCKTIDFHRWPRDLVISLANISHRSMIFSTVSLAIIHLEARFGGIGTQNTGIGYLKDMSLEKLHFSQVALQSPQMLRKWASTLGLITRNELQTQGEFMHRVKQVASFYQGPLTEATMLEKRDLVEVFMTRVKRFTSKENPSPAAFRTLVSTPDVFSDKDLSKFVTLFEIPHPPQASVITLYEACTEVGRRCLTEIWTVNDDVLSSKREIPYVKSVWFAGIFYHIMLLIHRLVSDSTIRLFIAADFALQKDWLTSAVCTLVRSRRFDISSFSWVAGDDKAYKDLHSAMKTFNAFEPNRTDTTDAIREQVLSMKYHVTPEGLGGFFYDVLQQRGLRLLHFRPDFSLQNGPFNGKPIRPHSTPLGVSSRENPRAFMTLQQGQLYEESNQTPSSLGPSANHTRVSRTPRPPPRIEQSHQTSSELINQHRSDVQGTVSGSRGLVPLPSTIRPPPLVQPFPFHIRGYDAMGPIVGADDFPDQTEWNIPSRAPYPPINWFQTSKGVQPQSNRVDTRNSVATPSRTLRPSRLAPIFTYPNTHDPGIQDSARVAVGPSHSTHQDIPAQTVQSPTSGFSTAINKYWLSSPRQSEVIQNGLGQDLRRPGINPRPSITPAAVTPVLPAGDLTIPFSELTPEEQVLAEATAYLSSLDENIPSIGTAADKIRSAFALVPSTLVQVGDFLLVPDPGVLSAHTADQRLAFGFDALVAIPLTVMYVTHISQNSIFPTMRCKVVEVNVYKVDTLSSTIWPSLGLEVSVTIPRQLLRALAVTRLPEIANPGSTSRCRLHQETALLPAAKRQRSETHNSNFTHGSTAPVYQEALVRERECSDPNIISHIIDNTIGAWMSRGTSQTFIQALELLRTSTFYSRLVHDHPNIAILLYKWEWKGYSHLNTTSTLFLEYLLPREQYQKISSMDLILQALTTLEAIIFIFSGWRNTFAPIKKIMNPSEGVYDRVCGTDYWLHRIYNMLALCSESTTHNLGSAASSNRREVMIKNIIQETADLSHDHASISRFFAERRGFIPAEPLAFVKNEPPRPQGKYKPTVDLLALDSGGRARAIHGLAGTTNTANRSAETYPLTRDFSAFTAAGVTVPVDTENPEFRVCIMDLMAHYQINFEDGSHPKGCSRKHGSADSRWLHVGQILTAYPQRYSRVSAKFQACYWFVKRPRLAVRLMAALDEDEINFK